VAQSSCEAEYYSADDATREAIHIRQLLSEIHGVPISDTTTIWEDSQSTIAYRQNALVNDKTKHTGLKYYFVKDHVSHGTIRLMYLATSEMVADILTKPLHGSALSNQTAVMMGATGPMHRYIP
jgi:hypothetical protein